jgi:hypothetical protein
MPHASLLECPSNAATMISTAQPLADAEFCEQTNDADHTMITGSCSSDDRSPDPSHR